MLCNAGEFGLNRKILITDSLISCYERQFGLVRIDSFVLNKDGSYLIISTVSDEVTSSKNYRDTVTINIIDTARGIALFTHAASAQHPYLMVDASKARSFPIMYPDCTVVLDFWDQPDYKELLIRK